MSAAPNIYLYLTVSDKVDYAGMLLSSKEGEVCNGKK